MSTHAMIGIKRSNGTVDAVYCHFDGYPSGVGTTLEKNYKTTAKVKELLSYGDMSGLDKNIDLCIFYGRDRKEKNTSPKTYKSVDQYLKEDMTQYSYLFKNGKWYGYAEFVTDKYVSIKKLAELVRKYDGD